MTHTIAQHVTVFNEEKVRYFLPGAFFSEDVSSSVPERDPQLAIEQMPSDAFAFEFFTKVSTDPISDGMGGSLQVLPRETNKSGKYYPGGVVYVEEQVERLGKEGGNLLSNMRINGWDKVVKTRIGNWQPLELGDVVL